MINTMYDVNKATKCQKSRDYIIEVKDLTS